MGLLCSPFIQSRKCLSLKFTGDFCIMTVKNDAKFKEELTRQSKIDMRNLTNFGPLKNLHFNRLLLKKVYNVWARKMIGWLCLMALNIDATFDGKLTCSFKNDRRNLTSFHHSTFESLKIGTFVGSFYPR